MENSMAIQSAGLLEKPAEVQTEVPKADHDLIREIPQEPTGFIKINGCLSGHEAKEARPAERETPSSC